MATLYSDQFTKIRAGRNLQATDRGGKIRIAVWDFATLPAGSIGDILVCFRMEPDERWIEGKEFHSALTSGAGAATGSYGTYTVAVDGVSPLAVDDVDRFLAATSWDAAGQGALGSLQGGTEGVGTGPLFIATVPLLVCVTNSVEAFATAGRISGWAKLVKD